MRNRTLEGVNLRVVKITGLSSDPAPAADDVAAGIEKGWVALGSRDSAACSLGGAFGPDLLLSITPTSRHTLRYRLGVCPT